MPHKSLIKTILPIACLALIVSCGTKSKYDDDDIEDDTYESSSRNNKNRNESTSPKVELMPVSAECAWTLKSQTGKSYHPMQMFDGNNATCWSSNLNEIAADCDVRWGPTIDFGREVYLEEIRMTNGYAKDYQTWNNNARVAGLIIFDADKGYDFEDDDITENLLFRCHPKDIMNQQTLKALPGASSKKVRRVGLGFTNINTGIKFDDLCISELKFIGHPAD